MISNERPSPYGNRDRDRDRSFRGPPPPPKNETTIKTAKVQIERKTFIFALKENPRGRFLRITEDVGGRHDTIIIPAPGLEEFRRTLEDVIAAGNDHGQQSGSEEPGDREKESREEY